MRRPSRAARPDAGFVLIGVVVFVLALTIVALSLYGLSGYEGQFLADSLDREQAFQSAMGGLERARSVLTIPPYRLEGVRSSLPLENVIAAVAVQAQNGDSVSSGTLDWRSGEPVRIRVTAEVGHQRRVVEGLYLPRQLLSVYRHLIATDGGLDVRPQGGTPSADRRYTVQLLGPIWESSAGDTNAWKPLLRPPLPEGIRREPHVETPGVARFLAQPGHLDAAAAPMVTGNPDRPDLTLDAGIGGLRFFRSPDESVPELSYHERSALGADIRVKGRAVWLFPRGVRFEQRASVRALGADACLVIVAGPNGTDPARWPYDPEAGIWFAGGLEADIPVILVSDGEVLIEHLNGPDRAAVVTDLCLYAGKVTLLGPTRAGGMSMQLQHSPVGPLDSFYIDQLAALGALPNVASAGDRELALVPRTWRELRP